MPFAGARDSTPGSATPLKLPYEFDTTGVVKVILRGTFGLLTVVIVPGIPYSIFVSHSTAAVIQMLLIGGVTSFFGWMFLRYLTSARGIITSDSVVIVPSRLYGIRLPGPVGKFPVEHFKSVRVERIVGPLRTTQAPRRHERVYLIGKPETPDILVARTALDAGVAMGRELATALNLPYVEESTPY